MSRLTDDRLADIIREDSYIEMDMRVLKRNKLPSTAELYEKLNRYERIEEQLGCSLEVVWKATNDGFYNIGGKHFTNFYREARGGNVSAVGRGLSDLSGERGGSHLTACHAVDGIVDENDGDVFVSCSGMDCFSHTDGRQVTVTLVGEDDVVGVGTLQTGRNGRCAAVSRFHHIAGEIVISHNGTAYRGNAYGLSLDAELVDSLGN